MFSSTVTVFNRYKSRLGDMWYPTVISGVNVNIDKAAIVAKYGSESKDNAILNIHYNFRDGAKIICEKPYLPPKEWENQTNDLLPKTITFTSGEEFDFFILGDYVIDEPISDNDYLSGFYDYMNRNQDFVFAITAVAEYSAIPHFEIMGA